MIGEVESVVPAAADRHRSPGSRPARACSKIKADYIIDGTGLEAGHRRAPVAGRPARALAVRAATRSGGSTSNEASRSRGTRNENGRMYASGASTLGGYFPGVDTFLGLQIAGQEIADDLISRASASDWVRYASTRQWLRWARNKKI